jgi:hypothetical protein
MKAKELKEAKDFRGPSTSEVAPMTGNPPPP